LLNPKQTGVFLLLILLHANVICQAGEKPVVELRVLIDVSGSMKKNDPQNLRIPALRLLTGLLPEKSRSAAWLFAKKTTPLIGNAVVNKHWKQMANAVSGKIHARGQFTDIERALHTANNHWATPAEKYRRHILLLSDGVVDVPGGDAKSDASRQRILEKLLPALQKNAVKVHTIALSNDADHPLLQAISGGTDGWYEKVEDADQLNRAFLHLFEQSAKQPSLPLKENRFKVDDSIKDMTILVFHAEDSEQINVITPNGQAYQWHAHPNKVEWHREQGFDLITVNDPVPGDWQLDAKQDPDNRVLVVTNLDLQVSELPNYLIPGTPRSVHAQLLQKGKPVTLQALIERTRFILKQTVDNETVEGIMFDHGKPPDQTASDGIYSQNITEPVESTSTELIVSAAGPTFERQYRHQMKVLSHLLAAQITQLDAEHEHKFRITLRPSEQAAGISFDSVKFRAPPDVEKWLAVPASKPRNWVVELHASWAEKFIEFNIEGHFSGQPPFVVKQSQILPKDKSIAPVKQAKPAHEHEPVKAEKEDDVQEVEEKAAMDWKVVIAFVLIINGIAGLIGLVGFLVWQKRRQRPVPPVETEQAQKA